MADTLLSKEQKKAKPLGQRLLDKGYITADQVRDIMAKQTLDQIFALAHWQNGVFEFDESDAMPEFTIRIVGSVQALLLDAYRRIDEGEVMKTSKTVVDNEVCYGCPVAAECSPRIKEKLLEERPLPVAPHGGHHRRRLRARAGLAAPLQVARRLREAQRSRRPWGPTATSASIHEHRSPAAAGRPTSSAGPRRPDVVPSTGSSPT